MKKITTLFLLLIGLGANAQNVEMNNDNIQITSKDLVGLWMYKKIDNLTSNPKIGIYFGSNENGNYYGHGSIYVKQFEFSQNINGVGKFTFNTGFGEMMSISTSAITHNTFTKLGSDAPAIKMKKLTAGCTTSANSGYPNGEITVTHGLAANKILKVEALVEYNTNYWVKDGNGQDGYQFDVYITNTTISLRNTAGNASSEIRSKPCKILITYEE